MNIVYFISDLHMRHVNNETVRDQNGELDRRYFNACVENLPGRCPIPFTKIKEWLSVSI